MASEPECDDALIDQFLESASGNAPLRVAIVTAGTQIPRFSLPILLALRRCGYLSLVAALSQEQSRVRTPGASMRAIANALNGALYRLYLRAIDARAGIADPYALMDGTQALGSMGITRLAPGIGGALPASDRVALERLAFDVILDFSTGAVSDDLSALSRHGLWRYCWGDAETAREPAPQMRELMRGDPVSIVELRQYGPMPGYRAVLGRASFSMDANVAVSRSRLGPACGSGYLAIRELQRLQRLPAARSDAQPCRPLLPRSTHSAKGVPGNLELARWMGRHAWRALGNRLLRSDRVMHWQIALRQSDLALPDRADVQALRQFRWIDSPRSHFWADPFLFAHESDTWLFFEDFDYAVGRACLNVARIALDGSLGEVHPAVVRRQHLSYPHVFCHEGEIFMVPESSEQGVVELLRASRFPTEWQPEATLLRLKAVDSTLFQHNGKWWMFTSPLTAGGHAAVTLLYSACRLTGPWHLHPASPISSDARFARGAGAVFKLGDTLVRPSQDCGGRYGRALVFNEIRQLDEQRFEEAPFATLGESAELGLSGIHTYNRAGHWEVIDGRFIRRRFEL